MMLTHGGLSEVWIWDDRTYKMLGGILINLCSGDARKRQKGYVDFYEMKRHFYPEVFENYIERLDIFRIVKGVTPMRELVDVARREMVKQVPENVPPVSPIMPDQTCVITEFKERLKAKIECEQTSLF